MPGLNQTIVFFPEASYGAALNCVGIAQELRRMGANPVFICHGGFHGVFNQYGFPEYAIPVSNGGSPDNTTDWSVFIQRHRSAFRLSPFEQLETYVGPTWDAIVGTVIRAEPGLQDLIARLDPAAIVLDNVVMFPAILKSGKPWIRVVSCAETEIPDADVPPYLSGCSTTDRSGWETFNCAYERVIAPAHDRLNELFATCGLAEYPKCQFLEPSPHLNLLLAPEILRYSRRTKLDPERYVFLEGCVRNEGPYVPPPFASREQAPLIYTSFGSLGAIDTDMISRLIEVFGKLPYRFVVNVGAWRDSYRLVPDNVYLSDWFPQPSLVKQCDLFIHHGGNNSFCEALVFGVPSLIMPYCWDGHDNATRCEEAGAGHRIDRYAWSNGEMRDAIVGLLGDRKLKARLGKYSEFAASKPGATIAAEEILKAIR